MPIDWLSHVVQAHGLGVGLLAVFVGGLALNLTPCVYPMIPVTLAFFSRQSGGAVGRTLRLACFYVIGISSCYAVLGIVAASTGALLGSWLQQPVVLIGVALAVVALALSMLGVYELRLPRALAGRFGRASTGLWGAFVMGLVVGLVAAPCIGPFVFGLVLLVSQLANPVKGFLLFFAMGLGMGLPYIVLGVAANRIGQLPKAGAWLVWSKKLLGVVLLGVALYFLRPLLPARALSVAVIGLLLGAGMYLGWLERSHVRGWRFRWVRRLIGGALLLGALAMAWPKPAPGPSVAWIPYSASALERAQRNHQPIIVDVYADWCIPCVEMDHVTFHRPEVVQALAQVATLRIDVTRDVSPDGQTFLDRYEIYGAPTILFFDREGKERKELRALGFTAPAAFLERLSRILILRND